MVDAAFSGFKALPEGKPWWKILGFDHKPRLPVAKAAYLLLAQKHHPDIQGSEEKMIEINLAYEKAKLAAK